MKIGNQLTVWCFLKKFPCKAECQMWDLKRENCKLVLACNKIINEKVNM